jgi:hypothetical protein
LDDAVRIFGGPQNSKETNHGEEREGREKAGNKGRVKIGKLQLHKETVRELTAVEEKSLKGGRAKNKTDDTCLVIACSVTCI